MPLPEPDPPPARRRVDSVVVVNTGDGKGKSTAAFGVMGRGWARGWRVGVVQFMKSGDWKVGEQKLAHHLGVDWWTLGDGFTWESSDLDESAAKNVHAWEVARAKLASGDYDLLILDELTYVVNYGWVPVAEVVRGDPRPRPEDERRRHRARRPGRAGRDRGHRHGDEDGEARLRAGRPRHEGHRVLSPSELHVFDGLPALAVLVWRLGAPLWCASTATVGGGIGLRDWVLNAQVPPDYGRRDVEAHVAEVAGSLGLRGAGVGMLTAAEVADVARAEDGGVRVEATVGLDRPLWAAAPSEDAVAAAPGTVNVVAFLPVRHSDAALANILCTVTEAKVQALLDGGVAGTGTASDAVTVLCPATGPAEPFGGPRSAYGSRVARAVARRHRLRRGAARDHPRARWHTLGQVGGGRGPGGPPRPARDLRRHHGPRR